MAKNQRHTHSTPKNTPIYTHFQIAFWHGPWSRKPGQPCGWVGDGLVILDRGPTSPCRLLQDFLSSKKPSHPSARPGGGAIGLCSKRAVDDKQTPAPLNWASGVGYWSLSFSMSGQGSVTSLSKSSRVILRGSYLKGTEGVVLSSLFTAATCSFGMSIISASRPSTILSSVRKLGLPDFSIFSYC